MSGQNCLKAKKEAFNHQTIEIGTFCFLHCYFVKFRLLRRLVTSAYGYAPDWLQYEIHIRSYFKHLKGFFLNCFHRSPYLSQDRMFVAQ